MLHYIGSISHDEVNCSLRNESIGSQDSCNFLECPSLSRPRSGAELKKLEKYMSAPRSSFWHWNSLYDFGERESHRLRYRWVPVPNALGNLKKNRFLTIAVGTKKYWQLGSCFENFPLYGERACDSCDEEISPSLRDDLRLINFSGILYFTVHYQYSRFDCRFCIIFPFIFVCLFLFLVRRLVGILVLTFVVLHLVRLFVFIFFGSLVSFVSFVCFVFFIFFDFFVFFVFVFVFVFFVSLSPSLFPLFSSSLSSPSYLSTSSSSYSPLSVYAPSP